MKKKPAFADLPLAVLVAVAGCGSPTSPTATASSSPAFSPTATSSGSAGAAPTATSPSGSSSESSGNTISMTSYDFTQHRITVHASQLVVFDDLAGTHPVCVGTGTGGSNTCATASQAPNAPSQLVGSGIVLTPGHTVSITFKPGAYHLICTIHPRMYIDVTVQ